MTRTAAKRIEISRRDLQEILLARMAGGDLYANEEKERIKRIDKRMDLLRIHPIYKESSRLSP
jgi:hypothetical protein